VHLTPAISIIIPRPLMHTVVDSRMARMTLPVTLPLISREQRAASREILRDQGRAGARVGMVADPQTLLSYLARNHTDDRGPVMDIGPMPFAFIGAPPGRVGGSPLAMPRSNSTKLVGRCRVFAKTVPVRRV
jgi:hypothetical protein